MKPLEGLPLFEFRDSRQERIYRRLRLVGAGTPDYFKDACRLRQTEPVLATTTHLVSHLFREIESSLRDVLLVFADSTNRPNKDTHVWEIRQILKGLNIQEEDPIATLWLNIASGRPHKRAHRDNLQPPRPIDSDFDRFVDEMESVFDRVLFDFESKYLAVLSALDQRLVLEEPTIDDAKWLKVNVPNNQAALGYFFDRLNNPKWLDPLIFEGLFDRPPEPVYDPETNSTTFQPWPLSRYLLRMAGSEQIDVKGKVGEILLGIETTNFLIHQDIADAACLLPIDLATKIAEKETLWLREQRFIGHLVPDKFAELTVYLGDGNSIDAALTIAATALSFVSPEVQELSAAENYFGPEPRTRMDRWDYGQFMHRCWQILAAAAWKDSLDLFSGLLDDYLNRKHPERVESAESYSYIWHRDIENDEDGLPNRLLSTIRNIAVFSMSVDGSRLPEIIEILESHRWDVFRRIVLHLLRLYPAEAHETIRQRLLIEENFRNPSYFHEYVLLLAGSFKDLDTSEQRTILDWIDKSAPSVVELKKREQEWNGSELSDEDADKAIRWRKLKWLEPLKDVLPDEWREKYDAWTAELGRPDHPGFLMGVPQAMWVGESSGSEILSKLGTVKEVTDYLSQAVSERHESPQGLSIELSGLVEGDPHRFLSEAERFEGLAPIYIRSLLSGIKASTHPIPDDVWSKLLGLINWVMEQPAAELNLSERLQDPLDSDWVETRMVVSEFVSSVLSIEVPLIPVSLREDIWTVIRALTNDPNPTPDYEQRNGASNMDPLTMSLNSIRGKAFHLLFKFLHWSRDQRKEKGGLDESPEIRETLERHLEPEVDRSLAVRAVYGEHLPYLVTTDPEWVRDNLPMILPIEEEFADLRNAVWETFIIHTRPWDNVLDVMKDEYGRAIERLDAESLYRSESSANHLAEHLVVFYARGKFGLDDGDLLDKFYARASDRLAAHIFWFIGRILKNGDVPQEVLNRLANLAERRIENGHTHTREMEAFGWLFTSGKFDPEWSLLRLKDALQISPSSDPDHSVIEALAGFSSAFPRVTIECVALLVEGADTEWTIRYWSPKIRTVITSALEHGEIGLANALVNKLAARGFVDFRDLLP
jgi:hypothetical protein